VIDPSELLRPEPEFVSKSISKFRDYSIDINDPLKERVRNTYRLMHLNQTVDFVQRELIKYKIIIFLRVDKKVI
jgi:inositol oxygenase